MWNFKSMGERWVIQYSELVPLANRLESKVELYLIPMLNKPLHDLNVNKNLLIILSKSIMV